MTASSAIRREVRWRVTGTTAWSDIASCSPVAELTLENLDRTKTYDVEVRDISACGAKSAWVMHAAVVPDVAPGNIVLSDAYAAAVTAQADADAANAALANIASDNLLTAGEKPTVIRDWNVIAAEQAGIDAQATAYSITTEKTNYDNAVTALANYLGTLTAPKMWNDLSGDTTIVGATFRSNFASVYTTRQTLLNAIYAAAKLLASNAQSTATAANSNVPAIINGQFKNGTAGWTFDNPTGFYAETGSNSPDSACNTYLTRVGQAGGATTYARNLGYLSVVPGQTITAMCCVRLIGANTSAYAGCRISWRDVNHAEISDTLASVACGPSGTGNAQCVSKAIGIAPAGAQFAHFELYYVNHSSGFIIATSCFPFSIQPSSIDEVPDGSSRFGAIHNPTTQATIQANAAASYAPGQNMIRNPTGAVGNLHWTEVYTTGATPEAAIDGYRWRGLPSGTQGRVNEPISIGAGIAIVLTGEMFNVGITGGTPATLSIQFRDSGGGQIGAIASVSAGMNADWARYTLPVTTPAGTAAIKVFFMASPTGGGVPYWRNLKLEFGSVATPYSDNATQDGNQLTNPGSGFVLGNQLNAPNSLTLNYGAARTVTAVTASSTGAVSINAFSVNMGGTTVSYSAVSNAVTGLTQSVTYQIYCHDLGGTGGTKTWLAVAGTANALLTLGDDVVLAGQVTIPTSGTSGGGGGGYCVCDNMWIDADTLAGEAPMGHLFDCLDIPTQGMRKFRRRLQSVEYTTVPCVRITTDAGAILECSTTTPFDVLDGRTVHAPNMLGEQVVTDKGIEIVARVDDIGARRVCHIHLGGVSYAAGADPAHRIYSHNLKP